MATTDFLPQITGGPALRLPRNHIRYLRVLHSGFRLFTVRVSPSHCQSYPLFIVWNRNEPPSIAPQAQGGDLRMADESTDRLSTSPSFIISRLYAMFDGSWSDASPALPLVVVS
jgi:hypothetical protein